VDVVDVKRWFLPNSPDLIGLLVRQAEVTIDGLDAFVRWCAGQPDAEAAVGAAEHAADDLRRQLQRELRAAFSTPLEPEDLYELSERLDAVLNGAKNAVREAGLLAIEPDTALAAMAGDLLEGVRHLGAAFRVVVDDPDTATEQADAAIRCQRRIERTYRAAMSALVEAEDVRAVIAWREMYRRGARLGDLLERVAERVWYAVVKRG
jgi:uncharacterized protein Yka (UPF0111/DUF47 family)